MAIPPEFFLLKGIIPNSQSPVKQGYWGKSPQERGFQPFLWKTLKFIFAEFKTVCAERITYNRQKWMAFRVQTAKNSLSAEKKPISRKAAPFDRKPGNRYNAL